jgi:hypothetical protein
MKSSLNPSGHNNIAAIYDFELFPYALGDVLTWNVRTAIRCIELGREAVDIYICVDERYPAGIYQRGLVNPENFELFFSELYGAFGTHPRLGNIHIFRDRDALLAKLQELVIADPVNAEAVSDYLGVLEYRVSESALNKVKHALSKVFRGSHHVRQAFNRLLPSGVKTTIRATCLPNEEVLNHYFIKYIHSHESINKFAARQGWIPLLRPALGCIADVEEIIARKFSGKRIVPFHLRLRRLDAGYGGEHSYARDSDFLEWYDFLREAGHKRPDVEFVALGRLQEKPLELLHLPNVSSLRVFGMGLGHELTLMLKSDLFIGTSSGFAAMANFSEIPHFITRMNPGSCHAYAIPEGADRLPFARDDQKLIYAQETSELLMNLLEQGLGPMRTPGIASLADADIPESGELNVQAWLSARSRPSNAAATTSRFFTDEKFCNEETAYLLLPALEKARQALLDDSRDNAITILDRVERNFPVLCGKLPQHSLLREMAVAGMDPEAMRSSLKALNIDVTGYIGALCSPSAEPGAGWRPGSWVAVGGEFNPIPGEPQPAVAMRATGTNCYWHTERFVCDQSGGKVIVRFDARNSESSSLHRMYVFEDGAYRSLGEFFAETEWRSFEIPVATRPGAVLEFQIDQADANQVLSIRDFRVARAAPLPRARQAPVAIPMANWVGGSGTGCPQADGQDCRQWTVAGRPGYVQTPVLPQPGKGGLLIEFEARTDRPTSSYSAAYLFEGDKYRVVAQYAFAENWTGYTLLLEPDRGVPIKFQLDFPLAAETLSVRNFLAIPVEPIITAAT